MRINIRNATQKDVRALVALNSQLADYHFKIDRLYKRGSATRKFFRKHLIQLLDEKQTRILVTETNHRVIAYFIASIGETRPFLTAKRIGHITDAFVAARYRRSGIGMKMLTELIEWFRAQKIKHVELSVDARNEIGVKAWHTLGFKVFMLRMRRDL